MATAHALHLMHAVSSVRPMPPPLSLQRSGNKFCCASFSMYTKYIFPVRPRGPPRRRAAAMAAGGRRPAPSRGTRRSRLLAVTEIGVVDALKSQTRSARRACPPPTCAPRRAAAPKSADQSMARGEGDQRQRSSQQGAGLPQCGQSAWNGSDVVVDDCDVVVAMSNPFPPSATESFPFRKSGS